MRRRTFAIISGVSLLMCVGVVVLWVRSHTRFDDLYRNSTLLTPTEARQHLIRIGSTEGRLIFARRDIIWPSSNPRFSRVSPSLEGDNGVHFTHERAVDLDGYDNLPKRPNDRSWQVRFGGVRFQRAIRDAGSTPTISGRYGSQHPRNNSIPPGLIGVVVIVPHAYVAALLAVLPAVAILKRWRRPRRGMCRSCGYDLTGNKSGVCPECGTAVAGGKGVKT